ncbi:MAG: hypothetical protein J6C85_00055 [Alphaproteobacteria bacterium]|nr:hypothetical protein [Alphaproteobacteria bacterium]
MDKINQRGRSMIEMLGVLAIVGILSVSAIAGFQKAMIKHKTNKIFDEITTITANIQTAFANQRNYEELGNYNCNELVSLGIVSAAMCDATNHIKNAFGGEISLLEACSNADYNNCIYSAYSLHITGIPKQACIELATNNWQSSFEAIQIGHSIQITTIALNLSDCLATETTPDAPSKGYLWACKNHNQIPVSYNDAALACDCSEANNLCEFVFTGR